MNFVWNYELILLTKVHQDLKIFILFNILFNKLAQLMLILCWDRVPTLYKLLRIRLP